MWIQLTFKPGETGSENGIILLDEEYKEAGRITLEKCSRYYAITCGVYGAMVHTVFCEKDNYAVTYEAMKKELSEFINADLTHDEQLEFYERFTNTYC